MRFEQILQNNGVTIQAYYGSTLTGGAIVILLQKHKRIMDELEAACIEKLNTREHDISYLFTCHQSTLSGQTPATQGTLSSTGC